MKMEMLYTMVPVRMTSAGKQYNVEVGNLMSIINQKGGIQMKRNIVFFMVLVILCGAMMGIGINRAEAVCLANHTEMTIAYVLVDPTGILPHIMGKLVGDDKPHCFPGGHPKYGGARDVYFFERQAFKSISSPYFDAYKVHDTVAKHSTVVFAIEGGQSYLKDMSKHEVEVVDMNGTSIFKGKADGPAKFKPK
ncbi:MAG: hypothetical protein HQL01_04485 [Nitrospirae bacterium]|nr:hypothetical protein [Nitrospirota bacterium]